MDNTTASSVAVLDIREILSELKRFVDLLLIGDEQEDMIDRYLDSCRLFIGYIAGQPCACCAIRAVDPGTVEIMNLAVVAEHRRHGVGRARFFSPTITIIPSSRRESS